MVQFYRVRFALDAGLVTYIVHKGSYSGSCLLKSLRFPTSKSIPSVTKERCGCEILKIVRNQHLIWILYTTAVTTT